MSGLCASRAEFVLLEAFIGLANRLPSLLCDDLLVSLSLLCVYIDARLFHGCVVLRQVAGVVNTDTEAPIQYGYTASLTADSYTVS